MNLPNKLTTARLVLTALFVVSTARMWYWSFSAGFILFLVASITDYLDGYLARKLGMVTSFGKLMDPLADKVLVLSAFVVLACHNAFPAWVVTVLLFREFLVTGLRMLAASEGVVLAAEGAGKFKTGFQIGTAMYFMLFEASREEAFAWLAPVFSWPGVGLQHLGFYGVYFCVGLTLWSGVGYALKNRHVFRDM